MLFSIDQSTCRLIWCDLASCQRIKVSFFKWANPSLFLVYFWSFQTNNTNFTANQCKKCHFHPVYGTRIQTYNLLNMSCLPQPLDQGYHPKINVSFYEWILPILKTPLNIESKPRLANNFVKENFGAKSKVVSMRSNSFVIHVDGFCWVPFYLVSRYNLMSQSIFGAHYF